MIKRLAAIVLCLGAVSAQNLEELKIWDATASLGHKLIKRLNEQKPNENVFLSPLSVHSALSMAYLGASGKTKTEMSEALALNGINDEQLKSGYSNLLSRKHDGSVRHGFRLQSANRMYVSQDRPVKDLYRNALLSVFNADALGVDFAKKGKQIQEEINAFVEQKTNGLIKNILNNPLSSDTVLALINTLYFNGSWVHSFDEIDKKSQFNSGCESLQSEVSKWLTQEEHVKYLQSAALKAQMLRIPYRSKKDGFKAEMLIVLPNEEHNCNSQNWFKQITWPKIKSELPKMAREYIRLTMPKYEVESKLSLEEILPSMGFASAFDGSQADFKAMSDAQFKLDKVIHQAKMVVTENGTEAAAATIATVGFAALPTPSTHVEVKRSFYVAILYSNENNAGAVLPLFEGIVNKV